MNPQEFATAMRNIINRPPPLPDLPAIRHDTEKDHEDADALMTEVLTELGYGEGVAEFNDMPKWYA